MEESKKDRIIRLLKADVGMREICRIEGISNTPVYKVMEQIGMEHRKIGKRKQMEDIRSAVSIGRFICPGIQYCVRCKHIFESVCPLGGESIDNSYLG